MNNLTNNELMKIAMMISQEENERRKANNEMIQIAMALSQQENKRRNTNNEMIKIAKALSQAEPNASVPERPYQVRKRSVNNNNKNLQQAISNSLLRSNAVKRKRKMLNNSSNNNAGQSSSKLPKTKRKLKAKSSLALSNSNDNYDGKYKRYASGYRKLGYGNALKKTMSSFRNISTPPTRCKYKLHDVLGDGRCSMYSALLASGGTLTRGRGCPSDLRDMYNRMNPANREVFQNVFERGNFSEFGEPISALQYSGLINARAITDNYDFLVSHHMPKRDLRKYLNDPVKYLEDDTNAWGPAVVYRIPMRQNSRHVLGYRDKFSPANRTAFMNAFRSCRVLTFCEVGGHWNVILPER